MRIATLGFALALSLTAVALAADSIESEHLKNVQQVTQGLTNAGEGYFSPDGEKIVPGPITRLTDNPAADVLPVFSPDGRKRPSASAATSPPCSQVISPL